MTSCSGFDLTLRAIGFFGDLVGLCHSYVLELENAATEDAIALGNDVITVAKGFRIFVVVVFQVFHILIRHESNSRATRQDAARIVRRTKALRKHRALFVLERARKREIL